LAVCLATTMQTVRASTTTTRDLTTKVSGKITKGLVKITKGLVKITKVLVKITKDLVKITKDLVKITKDSVKITKDLETTTTKYSAGVANAPFPIQRRIEEALKRQNVRDLTIQGRNGVTQQVTASAVMQNNLANMLTTLGLMKPVQVLQGFQTLLRGVVEICNNKITYISIS